MYLEDLVFFFFFSIPTYLYTDGQVYIIILKRRAAALAIIDLGTSLPGRRFKGQVQL